MQTAKVLIDYSDYLKLKEYEKRYHQMKSGPSPQKEQEGQGSETTPEQRLEKTILTNENSDEQQKSPEKQTILDPITTPMGVQDISTKADISKNAHATLTNNTEKRKRPQEPKEPCYYIGVPKYKK